MSDDLKSGEWGHLFTAETLALLSRYGAHDVPVGIIRRHFLLYCIAYLDIEDPDYDGEGPEGATGEEDLYDREIPVVKVLRATPWGDLSVAYENYTQAFSKVVDDLDEYRYIADYLGSRIKSSAAADLLIGVLNSDDDIPEVAQALRNHGTRIEEVERILHSLQLS
ncbi:hypothetical protein ACIRS1_27380 [Kitasatospora sp. NPDC101176]|uniref:hypothetical protein n=1 Tax=Kitasatospora sp. NPDC101176 TaxID=3364099 RepID=UPI0037F274C5